MAIKKTKKKNLVKKIVKKKVKKVFLVDEDKQKVVIPKGECIEMVGRRKTSIARVKLFNSQGDIIVNDKLASKYFVGVLNASYYLNQPFVVTGTSGKFAAKVKVGGGGIKSQLGAVILYPHPPLKHKVT